MVANNDWLTFLAKQNAQIENNLVASFGNPAEEQQAAMEEDILCDLGHLGFISAVGEEADSFLQNQLSNDIKNLNETHSQLNAHCTAKGRALSLFRTFKLDNTYLLQLPNERIEASLKRLQMYVLMTKVTLEDSSNKYVAMGISGPAAETKLRQLFDQVPSDDNECVHNNKLLACKIPGKSLRYMLVGETQNIIEAWTALSTSARACSSKVWRWLDIQAGLPQIYDANSEAFVPQMLNLHNLDGISFQKGCYPGQEVVARMHFLGKLKRHMFIAHTESQQQPAIGDAVFVKDDDSKDGVGRIVDSQASPEGGFDLLAVLQIASAGQGGLHLNCGSGPEIKLLELPYEVTLEREDKPNVKA